MEVRAYFFQTTQGLVFFYIEMFQRTRYIILNPLLPSIMRLTSHNQKAASLPLPFGIFTHHSVKKDHVQLKKKKLRFVSSCHLNLQ